MATEINDGVLCVLAHNTTTGEVNIEYIRYDNSLEGELQSLAILCDTESSTFDDIVNYINKTTAFSELIGEFKYCDDVDESRTYQGLAGTYQSFILRGDSMPTQINEWKSVIEFNEKHNEKYNKVIEIRKYKNEIKRQYTKWCKALAINKAYRRCHNDKNVLTFSHRICGWSNPIYKLTSNFSLEVKTNFGYGGSSYFYTKLTFKGIEITPFSEWVQYEKAKTSEIVRYSAKYSLENSEWEKALSYCKDACNLSLRSEDEFVTEYIINECESMVGELERLLTNATIHAKDKHNNYYKLDKTGHYLIEYRGEKISGALDFISKIITFSSITQISTFIKRIEICNRKIQPILIKELDYIKSEIESINEQVLMLKPQFQMLSEKNKFYTLQKQAMRLQLTDANNTEKNQIDSRELIKELNKIFLEKFSEYPIFEIDFENVSQQYFSLLDQITNLNKVLNSISSYSNKIARHFK